MKWGEEEKEEEEEKGEEDEAQTEEGTIRRLGSQIAQPPPIPGPLS